MGAEGYLTVGLFESGEPGEVFIKMAKEGSTLSGLIQAFCRAFSLAIQYGLTLEEAVRRFKGMRFEPMGPTSNPDIPEALEYHRLCRSLSGTELRAAARSAYDPAGSHGLRSIVGGFTFISARVQWLLTGSKLPG